MAQGWELIAKAVDDAWPYVATILTSGTITALSTTLIVGSREKRARRSLRSYTETSDAATALRKYREVVLRYGQTDGPANDGDRDKELARRGSTLLITCSLIGGGELADTTQAYIDTAELFAVHDEDTIAADEIKAFGELMQKIAHSRKSAR
ncbi:hypothetical protein JOE58_002610 [Curtobacterium luteum]|uniref:Uncharacterized protein n=1 Tax=Curtobacterium luteum TaxID=33881 RepID=A0A8H9L2K9_9MICO|nr:hypothetical protein [Curtobacterium luteum]MBM7803359.1 hypothetical protein [Curtobacterium luteum]NUU51612.1 hypothetical protein [Curtobacterium luteum]GGL07790.1 hypothetical protein GCM10009769_27500 [Curtobacterium luteum]